MSSQIKNVFVLMLENRSFDHMLGYAQGEWEACDAQAEWEACEGEGWSRGAEEGR